MTTFFPVIDSRICVTDPSVPSRNFWTGEIRPICVSISAITRAMSIPTTLSHRIIRILMSQ